MKRYLISLWLVFVASAAFSQIESNYIIDTVPSANKKQITRRMSIKPSDLAPQNGADSLALLYNSIALTNSELDLTIKRIRTHAYMAGAAFILEGIGAACFAYAGNNTEYTSSHYTNHESNQAKLDGWAKAGTVFCVAGGLVYIASYVPLLKSRLKCDERGLVVSIPLQSKKK